MKNTAIVLAALSTLGLGSAAYAQQMGGGQGGQQGIRGGQSQQGQSGAWIMETEQVRSQLQQALQAYNNNLDDTSQTIVREAAQEVRQQAQQIIGGPSKRALSLAAQQLDELADKIETNQLQSTQQFRETSNQVLRQLNQVQQIQQALLGIEFQGIDEPQVSQYREQLNRAFQAYQNNNDQVAVAVLRSVYNDIRRQSQQVAQNQGGTNQRLLLNRAALQIRSLGAKIQNNDLQSVAQFRQTANQALQQLDQARELQQVAQQGQFWQSQFWQGGPGDQGPQTQQQFDFDRGGFGYSPQAGGETGQQAGFSQQGSGQQGLGQQQGQGQGQWFDQYQGEPRQQQQRRQQQQQSNEE